MIEILQKPKNALIKQYQSLFEMDGVDLEIRPSALTAVAQKALKRRTGARGLRSILEYSLLNTMYDLPSMKNVSKVVVEENVINEGVDPLLIYEDAPRVARGKARKG